MLLILLASSCTRCPSDAVCLERGWYYVDEPAEVTHVMLWLHGWNEDASHLRERAPDHQAFLDAGFRLLQPMGSENSWNSEQNVGRDELAFLEQVVADQELPVLVAGHSVGASMASELACQSDAVAGLGAMHGTFWDPMPSCTKAAKPVRQVHGTADTTWPMEGRGWVGMEQGDIQEAVELWHEKNVCGETLFEENDGPSTCTVWHCGQGEVRYCEHDGAHRMEDGFGERLAAWWVGQAG
ncbi:MAG: alpha/beta fold hydrolase [Proteobacteria bacterium]|nr:alpha/beta fold hydrolase [Pseudomonadota bacterium]